MRRPGLGLMLSLCLGGMSMFAESFHYLDITYLNKYNIRNAPQAQEVWDTLHLVASLQGIVNRKGPRLFVRFMPDPDDFWFDYCTKESGWLTGSDVIRHEGRAGLLELIGVFKDDFKGIVSYPDKPFASSNVASTVAGVESRLALRRDESEGSLYQDVMKLENRPKDELKLTAELMVPKGGSTGSPKNDAIRWAKERYLDTDMCSPEYMAYYIDMYWLTDPGQGGVFSNSTLTNHDFYIGHGAFFFDLGVWGDEIVFDDPGQPRGIDRETLLMLLKKQYQRAGGKTFVIGGAVGVEICRPPSSPQFAGRPPPSRADGMGVLPHHFIVQRHEGRGRARSVGHGQRVVLPLLPVEGEVSAAGSRPDGTGSGRCRLSGQGRGSRRPYLHDMVHGRL